MNILNLGDIKRFARRHPLSRVPLARWQQITEAAVWLNILDVQRDFKSAEDVKGYGVFNIHGNAYRLISVIRYDRQAVIVHEVMTHSDYDRWQL